jgi:hypothetical protein
MRHFRLLVQQWLRLTIIAVPLATGALAADSPDAFVKRFVAAIGGKDPAQVMALVDRRSLACLSGDGAELLSFTVSNWTHDSISPNFTSRVEDIVPDAPLLMDAFMPGRFDYPARPTRKLQIQSDGAGGNSSAVIVEIGADAGEWKILLACPKPGTMAWLTQQREEGKAKALEQAKAVDGLLTDLSADYRAELVSMAKGGHWIDAAHKIQKDRNVELSIAVLAMKKISPLP